MMCVGRTSENLPKGLVTAYSLKKKILKSLIYIINIHLGPDSLVSTLDWRHLTLSNLKENIKKGDETFSIYETKWWKTIGTCSLVRRRKDGGWKLFRSIRSKTKLNIIVK